MRQTLMTSAAIAVALALSACDRSGSADTENVGNSAVVNTGQDVAATGVGMASAVAGGTRAETYVPAAAMGDMYEIESAKIALQRSKTPAVRAMAETIIKDHTAMSDAMKAALPKANVAVTPAPALDERRQGMIDNLKAASDDNFDLAYLHQQLAAHTEALTLHREYAGAGDNEVLKAVASSAVPKIEHHLGMVRDAGGDKLEAGVPG
jgi:putative membrane protein